MPRSALRPRLAHLGVTLFALAGLVLPITRSGVWDPYELDNAEQARKVAVHLFGASKLAIAGDPATIPTTTDLGMGELPFTSMALSYRLFGWHDWSGRLPLALWGVAGVMSLYSMLARYVDRRAGAFAAVALVTMPLYFMQARTMTGDIVTLASFSIALAGLVAALVEPRWTGRSSGLAVAALGLVAGYLSRGLLFGVAAPLVSAGLAGVFGGRVVRFAPFRSVAAFSMLALGVGAAVQFFVVALPLVDLVEPLHRSLGMQLFDPTPRDSTFDRPIRQIGHALFPWSALLPFALARLLRAPVELSSDEAREFEPIVRLALLAGAAVTLAANASVVPYAGALPYVGVAALAGALGVALRDLERGASPSRVVSVGTVLFGAVLYVDLKREPVRALSTFTNEGIVFPSSFAQTSERELALVTAVFVTVVALAWLSRQRTTEKLALSRSHAEASAWLADRLAKARAIGLQLSEIWKGNLLFVFVVIEAALVGLGAMLFVGSHAGWASVARMPRNFVSWGLNAWWGAPLGLAAAAVLLLLLHDGFEAALRLTRAHRASAVVAAGVVAGAIASLVYYPAVAGQLSPKEVFETFAEAHGPTDRLAVLGMSPRSASFYFSGPVESFEEPAEAFPWLVHHGGAPNDERRWLVLRARDLPRMNALHRASFGENLPILDARSSQVLLASDTLGGRPSQNPLDDLVGTERPKVDHPLVARLADQLELVGWDLVDEDERHVKSVVPGKSYHLRFHYRVLKPIGGNWQSFVHIDGQGRRHNADHPALDGRYPMSLWRAGDYVRDDCEIVLEPNFLPGDYELFFGFFNSSTRMKVTEGDANEDRVVGGTIRVL